MISRLIGIPIVDESGATIMVQGVGYAVNFPAKALAQLRAAEQVEVFVHTHLRQDSLELFGFLDGESRRLFDLLLSVSGIGPKTALQIVDVGADKLIQSVQQADVATFASVPRVGKKLAQKIIIELRGKLGQLQELNLNPLTSQQQEVLDALIGLGFTEHEVEPLVRELEDNGVSLDMSVTKLVKELGQKRVRA